MEQSTLGQPASLNPVRDAALRQQLLSRREKLHAAAPQSRTPELQQLLRDVDAALKRMDAGNFGICETCQDSIENERLLLDPLCRNCLDHLSAPERRALEFDLDLAYQVQRGLLPGSDLTIDGWSMAYAYQPAGPVSGDYCDLIALENGAGFFMLGDVSGKGVTASMLMAQLHAIFRSLAPVTGSVTDLVAKANRIFGQTNPASRFATLVCGHVNNRGAVQLCNAGHCLPLHVSAQAVAPIDSTGLPLGLFGDAEYPSQTLTLARGDCLLLYTDGLSEAFNSASEQYGVDRICDVLRDRGPSSPKDLLAALLKDLESFRTAAPQADDLTIMVLRREV
jgi:sigma-B regulation protein RsbU (phosphoserine phosphatase)